MAAALSSSGGSIVVGGILKVLDQQRSDELGRLDLRKVSDRRRVVQHDDASERSFVPNTRKDMGSTNRVRGTPNESLWTRIAFDGTRPPGGMLAAFGHIPKQRGRHPHSSRLTEIGPHLPERVVGDGSAEDAQKRFAIASFGDVRFGVVSTEFSEVALKVGGSMQIGEHTAIEPGHRFNAAGIA